jgi:hypothetical protein
MEVRNTRWTMFLDPNIKNPFLTISISKEYATTPLLLIILYRYDLQGMALLKSICINMENRKLSAFSDTALSTIIIDSGGRLIGCRCSKS